MRYFNEPDLYNLSKKNQPKLCKNIGLFNYCVEQSANENLKYQIEINDIYTDLKLFSFKYRLMANAGTLYYSRIKKHHNFKEYYNINKEYFLELYSKNRRIKKITHPIQQLMEVCRIYNNGQCYYCGCKDFENIDHFLPEGTVKSNFEDFFPQLCVMSYNLIPSCGTCNRKKSTHVGKYTSETFIHPYFSSFLNETFLKCEASFNLYKATVTFAYIIIYPKEWLTSQKKRVEFQLNKLDILNRYSSKASSNLNKNLLIYQKILKFGGIYELKKHLELQAWSVANYLGANNWEQLMYLSLADDINKFSIYLKTLSTKQTKNYLNPLDINKL